VIFFFVTASGSDRSTVSDLVRFPDYPGKLSRRLSRPFLSRPYPALVVINRPGNVEAGKEGYAFSVSAGQC
jgi:hypothetical protein